MLKVSNRIHYGDLLSIDICNIEGPYILVDNIQ